MDRRTFIAGAGTLGAAVAGGWAIVDSGASSQRAKDLAAAAGAALPGSRNPFGAKAASGNALADACTVGLLVDSHYLFEYQDLGWGFDSFAPSMRWTRWDPSQSRTFARDVSVSIGVMQYVVAAPAPRLLRGLEVVAYFAPDGPVPVATFSAAKLGLDPTGRRRVGTSALTFQASMPDRVALQVLYSLDGTTLAPGSNAQGMIYLPLGGRDGLGTGLYAIAAPSRFTGAPPNFAEHGFTGSMRRPLQHASGREPDFDYLTVAIRPVKA